MINPFLKWPGSKRKHAKFILEHLPRKLRYYEPMCGSCAVALNVDWAKTIMVSDSNRDLAVLYNNLSRGGVTFCNQCRSMFYEELNNSKFYYAMRNQFNDLQIGDVMRSVLFLYMNKHGYNGLVRYNQEGKFNVPFGRYEKPYFPRSEMVSFIEWATRYKVQFCSGDYTEVMSLADKNSVIYIDPPFWPLSETAAFSAYDGRTFGKEQHRKLTEDILHHVGRGVSVAVSNHDLQEVRGMYEGAQIFSYEASRNISCKGEKRGKVRELLAVWDSN